MRHPTLAPPTRLTDRPMEYLNFLMTHNILLTAIMAFGLGMWVYFDRRQDARNVTLGSLLVAVAFWSFSFILWRRRSR